MNQNGTIRLGGARLAVGLGVTLLIAACYPSSDRESVEDFDVVMTWYESTYAFGTPTTYTMENKVTHICPPDDPDCTVDHSNDQLILDTTAASMEALGYTRVTYEGPHTDADLNMTLSVTETEVVGTQCIYGWYPGWTYWSPWCYMVPYKFNVGTLLTHLLDMRNPDPAGQSLPVVWSAVINGLLGDTAASLQERIETNIHEAFAQSPYLAAGAS